MTPTMPRPPRRLSGRLPQPRTTVRGRLTLLYGGLFLACGAALLALTYVLVEHTFPVSVATPVDSNGQQLSGNVPGAPPANPANTRALVAQLRDTDLHHLIVDSSIALGIMVVVSLVLGWLVAGRVLRPLRVITTSTQQISADNLHRRLALTGPADELRNLGDTIDGLLARLDNAFDSQRLFVANASHELRTPVTVGRTLLEMVLSDPDATIETYRGICHDVLDASRQQEQLIDALLTLARSQRGLHNPGPVDLAAIIQATIERAQAAARDRHIDITLDLPDGAQAAPRDDTRWACVSGDPSLITRLFSNLLDNAIRYNHEHGRIDIELNTNPRAGRGSDDPVLLKVRNTGPHVNPADLDRLLKPFQRSSADRTGTPEGFGLGLSIVASITAAHQADLLVNAPPTGGLDIELRFQRHAAGEPHRAYEKQETSSPPRELIEERSADDHDAVARP